jgi:hypothetical protein
MKKEIEREVLENKEKGVDCSINQFINFSIRSAKFYNITERPSYERTQKYLLSTSFLPDLEELQGTFPFFISINDLIYIATNNYLGERKHEKI